MTHPSEIRYKFQHHDECDGSIVFTISSKDQDFMKFLLNSIYLELDKSEYDMEGIVMEENLFRSTRKILIKKNSFKENLEKE